MGKKLLKDDQSINKKKILKAAIEVFLKKGYQHTTIREISTRSNLSTGTIYFHFKNKEEILKEVVYKIELIATGPFLEKLDNISPRKLLEEVSLELIKVMTKNFELILFLISASRNLPNLHSFLYEQFKAKTSELNEMFKQLIKKGLIKKINPEKAALFALSNSFSIVILKEGILKKKVEKSYYEEMNEFALDILTNGIF